jgi:hypothetical protein
MGDDLTFASGKHWQVGDIIADETAILYELDPQVSHSFDTVFDLDPFINHLARGAPGAPPRPLLVCLLMIIDS